MEVQFTDFENAAFSVFIVLASRVILAYELNLYIPLSQLDENMKRAHEPAAAVKQKFFFRRHLANPCKEVRLATSLFFGTDRVSVCPPVLGFADARCVAHNPRAGYHRIAPLPVPAQSTTTRMLWLRCLRQKS